ncbi:hypothetical protein Tco_0041649, partial [Tanacetum coccineum]
SSEQTNDVKKIHMAWSLISNDSIVRKIGGGEVYFWRESGPKVLSHEKTTTQQSGITRSLFWLSLESSLHGFCKNLRHTVDLLARGDKCYLEENTIQ